MTPVALADKDTQWFFGNEGERKGPFTEPEIVDLIKRGRVAHDTLIWKTGSIDWIKAADSELKTHFNLNEPPALTGESVSNTFVWIIAITPIVMVHIKGFIAGFVSVAVYSNPSLTNELIQKLWPLPLAVNIILCVLDERKLKKAGHYSEKLGRWIWLVPVYLFKRSRVLKQSSTYFVVWLICFFVSFYL